MLPVRIRRTGVRESRLTAAGAQSCEVSWWCGGDVSVARYRGAQPWARRFPGLRHLGCGGSGDKRFRTGPTEECRRWRVWLGG
ncbi:hypothetical protein SGFS_027780 [Streptomyces graminofaciens]|uniref:Uncharacterized protein n=1 Tax=Streptomyces graminofaciens TaxID=68212 RepID=A0ABN5VE35_9ACTN|nr:hypothetical protein SGFS_027780 [Streptomyces graminofaciens]